MKKKVTFLLLVVFVAISFAQKDKIFVPHNFVLNKQHLDETELRLIKEIDTAKINGSSVIEVKRVFKELENYRIKNGINTNTTKKANRHWVADDDLIAVDDRNTINKVEWSGDNYISNEENDQKAPTLAYHSNGDIYAAFENYNYTDIVITIMKSTDGGGIWTHFQGWTIEGDDLLFPSIVIAEGNYDKLFLSFYVENSGEVYVSNYNFTNEEWMHRSIAASSTENIRPRLCWQSDRDYYDVFVTWIEEDVLNDDLYFSRSSDFGETFIDPVKLIGGVRDNVDIAYGYGNLYIAYQDDGSPGKIYLIESIDIGNSWNSPTLISASENSFMYPRIAVSDHNNNACVFYTKQHSSTDHDIYYTYTWDGQNWADLSLETDNAWESFCDIYYMPFSSSGDDNFHLSYYDDVNIFYRFTDDPNNWSHAIQISENSNASNDDFTAVCANADNKGMVAWIAGSSGNYDVLFDAHWIESATPDINVEPTSIKIYQTQQ